MKGDIKMNEFSHSREHIIDYLNNGLVETGMSTQVIETILSKDIILDYDIESEYDIYRLNCKLTEVMSSLFKIDDIDEKIIKEIRRILSSNS